MKNEQCLNGTVNVIELISSISLKIINLTLSVSGDELIEP